MPRAFRRAGPRKPSQEGAGARLHRLSHLPMHQLLQDLHYLAAGGERGGGTDRRAVAGARAGACRLRPALLRDLRRRRAPQKGRHLRPHLRAFRCGDLHLFPHQREPLRPGDGAKAGAVGARDGLHLDRRRRRGARPGPGGGGDLRQGEGCAGELRDAARRGDAAAHRRLHHPLQHELPQLPPPDRVPGKVPGERGLPAPPGGVLPGERRKKLAGRGAPRAVLRKLRRELAPHVPRRA